MKKMYTIIAAILLSTAVLPLGAQSWVNYSNLSYVTDAEPSGTDIWITAKGGVQLFNTLTGTSMFFRKGDAGLPSSSVEQVAKSNATGVIWVGTYDAGVVEWDGDSWLTYPFPSAMLLYRMKFDGFGNLWLQTDAGLFHFNTTDHVYTFVNSTGGAGWDFNAWDFDITPDNKVIIFTGTNCQVIDAATLAAIDSFPNSDSPNVLACSPSNVRVYNVDEETYLINNGFAIEFEFKDNTFTPATDGLPEFAFVQNIIRGTDGALYAYVNNASVYRLDGLTWTYVDNAAVYFPEFLVYTDGVEFYFSSNNYASTPGVIHMSETDYVKISSLEYAFTSNAIKGLTEDADGNIFILSGSGQYQYNELTDDFSLFGNVPSIYGTIYDLRSVNGIFYCVNYGDLLEYYNGTSWENIPYADGYTSPYIFDYDVTSDGTIYFVNDDGAFKYKDGETTCLFPTPSLYDWGLSVTYDATRNLLWIGRMDGILKYDFVTQELIDAMDVPAMSDGMAIQEIKVAPNGDVWFGANNNKAYMYDGTEWTDYNVGTGMGFVTSFDFEGANIYFGITDGNGGVHVWDTSNDNWSWLSSATDPTLVSDEVSYMTVTTGGDLWIAHVNAGVSRLDGTPSVGIDEVTANNAIIYPNPVAQTLFVSGLEDGNYQYVISDLSGKQLWSSSQATHSINVSQFPSGIYLLQVRAGDKSVFNGTFIVPTK